MMTQPITRSRILSAVAIACALAAFAIQPAVAQTASKLKCRGCVKSKHIKNKSIKSIDIKDGQVKKADLAAGAVDSAKIIDGTVGEADLADGAVTFEKLAADAVFMTTVVVSPIGPTATDNCHALQGALAGITDNDADNRYLIYVEPGVYDCGATHVQMKPYVDIQGAGQNATLITGAIDNTGGVLRITNNSGLRHLTVENTGAGGGTATGVSGSGSASKISHVTARASGGTTNVGLSAGSNFGATSQSVTDVIAEASTGATARGVRVLARGADLDNVVARARGATTNEGMRVDCSPFFPIFPNPTAPPSTVRDSVLDATTSGLAVQGTITSGPFSCVSNIRIANTELIGARGLTGSYLCAAVYDYNDPTFLLDQSCQ